MSDVAVVTSKQDPGKVEIYAGDTTAGQAVNLTDTLEKTADTEGNDISEEEFEALLDKLHGTGKHKGVPKVVNVDKTMSNVSNAAVPIHAANPENIDQITDVEFERLLDELHGEGRHPGATAKSQTVIDETSIEKETKTVTTDSDEITEEEFDELLDQIHGKSIPGASTVQMKDDIKQKEKPEQVKDNTQSQAETTVRVDTRRLDVIMNLVGELVLLRNRIKTFELMSQNEDLGKVVARFGNN